MAPLSFFKNGNIKSEWNFKDGVRDGVQKTFWDGSISDETETSNGVQNGFMRIYDREGELLKEIYLRMESKLKFN